MEKVPLWKVQGEFRRNNIISVLNKQCENCYQNIGKKFDYNFSLSFDFNFPLEKFDFSVDYTDIILLSMDVQKKYIVLFKDKYVEFILTNIDMSFDDSFVQITILINIMK